MTACDIEVDVVVVGFGIAGACAAIEAKLAGAEVLVLERASGGGGASAVSSGIFYLGGGTPIQKMFGYQDNAEEMYKFLLASTEAQDPEAIRLFCDNSLEHFNWLESLGVPFERSEYKKKAVFLNGTECLFSTGNEKIWPYKLIAKPVPRGHKVAGVGENAGAEAMKAILAHCNQLGIAAKYDCQVQRLLRDELGRVVGVEAKHNGQVLKVGARGGVVMATGGFSMNTEMVKANVPLISETAVALGIPSTDGSGIVMGQQVGAATAAMDQIIATASIYPPGQLIKGIVINKQGKRFVAEDCYHGRLASMIMEQPDQTAYLIVDAEIFSYPEIESAQHALIDGWDDIPSMEAGLGISEGVLQQTLTRYNEGAAKEMDLQFYKSPEWLKPLDQGPYAAFDISFNQSIYLFMTLGGLNTDAQAQVLDAHHHPITGLYAAGACAVHIPRSGKTYASGMSLGPGSFFGRIAGRAAAKNSRLDFKD